VTHKVVSYKRDVILGDGCEDTDVEGRTNKADGTWVCDILLGAYILKYLYILQ
jgi:hypothetical protein